MKGLLSNSSSFIWQRFKRRPFTTSGPDSFQSFFSPDYIKAIYCNSRRQTRLLVFLPQTLLLLYAADEFVIRSGPPLFLLV